MSGSTSVSFYDNWPCSHPELHQSRHQSRQPVCSAAPSRSLHRRPAAIRSQASLNNVESRKKIFPDKLILSGSKSRNLVWTFGFCQHSFTCGSVSKNKIQKPKRIASFAQGRVRMKGMKEKVDDWWRKLCISCALSAGGPWVTAAGCFVSLAVNKKLNNVANRAWILSALSLWLVRISTFDWVGIHFQNEEREDLQCSSPQ